MKDYVANSQICTLNQPVLSKYGLSFLLKDTTGAFNGVQLTPN